MIVTEYMSHGALDDFLRVSDLGPGGGGEGVGMTMLFLVPYFPLWWVLELALFLSW